MKKISFIVGFFFFLSLITWHVFVQAASPHACSKESIASSFSKLIVEKHPDTLFSSRQNYTEEEVFQKIYRYIQNTSFHSAESYHALQNTLFESAILQSLQSFEEQKTSFTWNYQLSQFPIPDLYKQKFEKLKSLPDMTPTLPTLVLGLQATLHYAVFSCDYSQEDLPVKGGSYQDTLLERNTSKKEKAEQLLEAKRILDYSLNSYDALAIAYPQHKAYEKLIDELKKLRTQFGTFEEISSSCVPSNHYPKASCKK